VKKEKLVETIKESFAVVPDPRLERTRLHDLTEILIMALVATLCGADGFVGIEVFCKGREEWFREILELKNGIPSHDTFGRVFAAMNPKALGEGFRRWTVRLAAELRGEVVAIDGKCLRRSFRKAGSGIFTHMVSAFATKNGLVLGQVSTDEKSNEIEAIPRLLELLDLKGALVTIDAMGCQKNIADAIVEGQGDYVLAVKENQPSLFAEMEEHLTGHGAASRDMDYHATKERGHGRTEERRCWVSNNVANLVAATLWTGLATVIRVEDVRTANGKAAVHNRYFISSRRLTAKEALHAIRSHWAIENQLHWVLDVAFREDESRVRIGNAAENLSVIRQLAFNMLKIAKGPKCGVQNRRMYAGQKAEFLLAALSATV
jgi:predicted transposase YbfD/YdcC